MRRVLFIRNPIYLIFLAIFVSIIFTLLLYSTIKLEGNITKKMMEISTADVISIANNNASYIEKSFKTTSLSYTKELIKNQNLREKIEANLALLLTSNIKYAYLLYRDDRGIFRFLADGAIESEKAFLNQKFDIDNPKWLEIFDTKKPLIVEHGYLQQISITYLVPILKNNEVELILAVDFSIKKIEDINKILNWMKYTIVAIIIIVIIFLIIFLIQTFKYLAIKKSAFTDKLTGVYNRNYLQESENFINLNDYILATLDIDYFKAVNDTYGHVVGDKILTRTAQIITSTIRLKEDIVIRYGGEEFIILAKINRNDNLSAVNVIERIFKNIQEAQFYINNSEFIKITVSIGVNLVPYKSRSFADAFKLADLALYNAKNKGRNNIEIYDERENKHNDLSLSINEIKDAIEKKEITCFYQKIVDTKTQEISHYEALLRIIDKNGNIILPEKILPVIRGTFILRNITKAILKICYKQLQENKDIKINVNLNPKDIIDNSILQILRNFALEDNISNRLGLEIVESEDLITCKEAKDNLLMLKNLGYKLFIDDFGSGYSNFIYLTEIKTDYIKIDGSIISKILEDKICFLLVKSIIDFAKEANIKVVAEYVINKEIYEMVKLLGVDYVQGYYFSIPQEMDKSII
ncbi:MAG: EAL domain-containing protein [Aliarcobacter sp.]|nr:EAL domain-containing protein [Aliarcobacter sp.]MDD2887689.1 EAL domain-containing protein [Aliarcobacter sp.]